jgi:very-short-patch-repair endonuclease
MFITYNSKLVEPARQLRNNSTPAEIEMWRFLQANFPEFKFLRQKPLENFIADFYCASQKLIIEIDGEIHESQKDRDKERDNFFIAKYGIKTVRFTNQQVFNDKEFIRSTLLELCTLPPLLKGG